MSYRLASRDLHREELNPLLCLGDNFYDFGVDSADDKQFEATWKDVYTHKALHKPWLVIEGNHDQLLGKTAVISLY